MIHLALILIFLAVAALAALAGTFISDRLAARAAVRRRLRESRPHQLEPTQRLRNLAAAGRALPFADHVVKPVDRHPSSSLRSAA